MAFQILQADNLNSVTVATTVLNPAEAEVRVRFQLQTEVAKPELRGRLMGPRSAIAGTVEIAHALRPLPKAEQTVATTVTGRVIIPEPSFWEPLSPFLYEGPLELWSDGKALVRLQVSHGLRVLRLGTGRPHWNGKPLVINGRRIKQVNDAERLAWRQAGVNAWLIDADERAADLCRQADRHGFFVFVTLTDISDLTSAAALAEYACCLGWIVTPEYWQRETGAALRHKLGGNRRQLLGLEMLTPQDLSATGLDFVYGQVETVAAAGVAKLIQRAEGETALLLEREGVLGVVGR